MSTLGYDAERIARLRQKALDGTVSYDEFFLNFYDRFAENADLIFREHRYADAYRYACEQVRVCIDEDELIVGRMLPAKDEEEKKAWRSRINDVAKNVFPVCGQESHMTVDYELLLQKGVGGVLQQVRTLRETVDAHSEEGSKKQLFYDSCIGTLEGVLILAHRYAAQAAQQAQTCTDAARRQELQALAAVLEHVPEHPANSFYEALQSIHFLTMCLSADPSRWFSIQQFQLGRLDRYLLPYYEADKAAGKLTEEQAQTLLDCLGVQINRRVCNGLSSGYMVGGRDENGNVVSNDLTRMGMKVIEQVKLVYPAVGLCTCPETPQEDLQLACSILSKGHSHPAIFNDDLIAEGLQRYGIPESECRNYIHSTCVEITPIAASNVWVASPYTNLPQLLLDSMDREYASMEDLLETYRQKLSVHITKNFIEQNQYRILRQREGMEPLLSCFVNDCLKRGCDLERGGARYNWTLPSFVGLANLADSFYTLQKLVFEEKSLTMAQLRNILEENYEGQEPLRLRILNGLDKYGNDVDAVDHYALDMTAFIAAECKKHVGCFENGNLIPSVFCWIMHERFGSETGALPDGRKAGFPLGDGSGSAQGREKSGPTASVLSATKWDHANFIGGVAVNMKFSKKMFTASSQEKMMALIETYLRRGGFEIQINVTDAETLKKAQQNPENYRDLVVRIGGYSDYFVKLSPAMQAEVLLRTEHEI